MPRRATKRCPTCGSKRRNANGAELLLMGANPGSRRQGAGRRDGVYDSLSVNERLAFGRLGLGKAKIQTKSDLARARKMVSETQRLKNRLPNPPAGLASVDGEEAEAARDLREGFSGEPSKNYTVSNEPHVPSGDYSDCGEFIAVAIKPTPSGETQNVMEILFPGRDLEWVCEPYEGRQLYIVGVGQALSESEIRIYTASNDVRALLGECRVMSYGMVKYGSEVPVSARGEDARWDHKFGEEGGECPPIWYDRKIRRLILGAATYRIQGSWVRN